MDNLYERQNGEVKEITDPLQETDMNTFQKNLEQKADNLQDIGSRRAQQQAVQQQIPQDADRQTTGTVRYEKGYYDGYQDALEEINERLAAGDDDYDFGRSYNNRKNRGRQTSYEDFYREEDDGGGRKKRRKKRGHPVLVTIVVLLILLIGGGALLTAMLFSRVTRVEPVADTAADAHANEMGVLLTKDPAVKNILLIGSDSRGTETERQRSDTMIICSFNANSGSLILTSLMRDMYVPIPDYGYNKLNAAYAYGDLLLLDETIQEDFGVDINGNVFVDFDGFIRSLTVVGNIDVELTEEEANYLNGGGWEDQGDSANDGTWNLHGGMNSLTPAQALAYCRIRYIGNSDWDRTERQRKVIMAALSKFKHSNPLVMYKVLSGCLESVTTDMTNRTLLELLFRVLLLRGSRIENYLIPVDGTYYIDYRDGMDVLVPDLEQNSAYLKEYIYG